jgi:hypothetical protein
MDDFFKLNEPKVLPAIWFDTRASGFTMASEPLTCSLLRTLAASKPSARFLELGSGTGLYGVLLRAIAAIQHTVGNDGPANYKDNMFCSLLSQSILDPCFAQDCIAKGDRSPTPKP